jgi:hypothetical protein
MMAKKKTAAPKGKTAKAKPKRGESSNPGDPEWEDLEERFNTLSSDFKELAHMAQDEEK